MRAKTLALRLKDTFSGPLAILFNFFYHTHQRLGVANMHVSLSKLSVFAVSV